MELDLAKGLSPEQAQFALLLEKHAPYLLHIWDFNKKEYSPELVKSFFGTGSSGEIVMLKFFLAVWLGEDKFNFDITDAASKFSREEKQVITDWLLDPFWP